MRLALAVFKGSFPSGDGLEVGAWGRRTGGRRVGRVVVSKLLRTIPVLFAVSVLCFLLTSLLPGDPATAILGTAATPSAIKQIKKEKGLDRPLVVQYGIWIGQAARGNLGRSYQTTQPVAQAIEEHLPVTLELVFLSQVFALPAALGMGLIASRRPLGLVDRILTAANIGALSIPTFVVGIWLAYLFAVRLRLFPATGYVPFSHNALQNIRSLTLPALSLGIPEVAVYFRLFKSDLLDVLRQPFILMADSKGLPRRQVLLRHALRPSLFTVVTVAGLTMGRLIGGALIVEAIFAIPGVGGLTVIAINSRDYVMVQGLVLVIATGYVVANLAVDALYSVLDPRIGRDAA